MKMFLTMVMVGALMWFCIFTLSKSKSVSGTDPMQRVAQENRKPVEGAVLPPLISHRRRADGSNVEGGVVSEAHILRDRLRSDDRFEEWIKLCLRNDLFRDEWLLDARLVVHSSEFGQMQDDRYVWGLATNRCGLTLTGVRIVWRLLEKDLLLNDVLRARITDSVSNVPPYSAWNFRCRVPVTGNLRAELESLTWENFEFLE